MASTRHAVIALALAGVLTTELVPAHQIIDEPAIRDRPSHPTSAAAVADAIAAGRRLFQTRFNIVDGAGRPAATGDSKPTYRTPGATPLFHRASGPDAGGCVSCHNQPRLGASGDFVTNVFQGAHFLDPLNDSIGPDSTNERGTSSLFGSGAIEILASEMTEDLLQLRDTALAAAMRTGRDVAVTLSAKGVSFGTFIARPDGTHDSSGVMGVDQDLVVKPFGVKGVAVSLREFTVFALNHHHGIQPEERFGWLRTGVRDFDRDGVEAEFSVGQVTALSLFQATLPPPVRARATSVEAELAIRAGEAAFAEVGCTTCHVPALPLGAPIFREPNMRNRPGAAVSSREVPIVEVPLVAAAGSGVFRDGGGRMMVGAYTDLKRHRICDDEDPFFCNERLRQDFVPTDQFITARLWDVGSTAPYGHRGNLTTLSEVILHHAGEARPARVAFMALPAQRRRDIVRFLNSLVIPESESETTFTPEVSR